MADMEAALSLLRKQFPEATIGVDNYRPYARTPDGTLYGVLFGKDHLGDSKWARGPVAVVRFPTGKLDPHNFEIVG